jgi:hypothetical protein
VSSESADLADPTPLTTAVVLFLVRDDWPFSVDNGGLTIRSRFQGENGAWALVTRIHPERQQLAVYSVWEEHVPEAHRANVAEFLHRANYGLVLGNFEIDLSDGEVRFKVGLDVEGVHLDRPRSSPAGPALVKQAFYAAVSLFDKYLPGLRAVAGGADAHAAVRVIEGPDPVEARSDDADA